jgi:hypothetical protein
MPTSLQNFSLFTFANGGKELSRKLHNELATKEMEVFDFAKSRKNIMCIGYQG